MTETRVYSSKCYKFAVLKLLNQDIMNNRFPKEKFEQVAAENGYEVFTPDQIASYYKEGIEKSLNDKMSEAEKKEFVADCMYLSKAVLVDKDGAESTVYFRKSQVNWEKAEDGTIMKGVAGVYADTPANRLLGRVGEAYIPDEEFMKSLDSEENEIAKAARTGRYADTPENRRLHRVGQPYKKREGKGGQEEGGNYGDGKTATKTERSSDAAKKAVAAASKDSGIKDKLVAAAKKYSDDKGWGDSEESIRKNFEQWMKTLPKDTIEGIIGGKSDGKKEDDGYDSPAIVAGNSRHALESALGGKLKWNEVDDGVYAIEGGEDGRNKQLGNFGITIDTTDKKYPGGKVTLYDVESGNDIKTVNGNSYNAIKKLGEEIKSKVSGGSKDGE